MNPPCLKVDLDGTEILPKKYEGIKWGEDVLENDVRDAIREEAERLLREEEERFEEEYEEYYSDDDEEDDEEEEDEDDYEEDALPSGVLMGYIETLGKYGFADIDKLSRLSPDDWDDLKENVGIEADHEKHLLAGLGIKRPKKREKKYRKRSDYEEEEEDSVMGDDEEPSLESELFAMATSRRQSTSVDDDAIDLDSPTSKSESPKVEVEQVEEVAVVSLRDRIAARKKEGSFDDGKPTEGGLEKKLSDMDLRGSESSAFKERIAARKRQAEEAAKKEEEDHHSVHNVIALRKAQEQHGANDSRSRGGTNSNTSSQGSAGAGASMDLSAPDLKAILRERIAARKQDKPTPKKPTSPRLLGMMNKGGADVVNKPPTPPRGRSSSKPQELKKPASSETIIVPLDKEGKVIKDKKSSRTRAPTPGRSGWAKPSTTTPTTTTSKSSSSSSSSSLEKSGSFSKPSTPSTKDKSSSSRYTSPYRQRVSGSSSSSLNSTDSTTTKSSSDRGREKSPRVRGLGRFIKG